MNKRLARGLDYLLSSEMQPEGAREGLLVALDAIEPNPYQPRRTFHDAELAELAASIQEQGVIQPVILREHGNRYQLIAGERRCRAARLAGLEKIPAVVRVADDTAMLELALVENLQREDLDPIESAQGYVALMERLGLTQEDVARRVGKSRPAIANSLRLLDLPRDLQELVSRGTLSAGHARALLGLADVERQRGAAARVSRDGLSVRALEELVRRSAEPRPAASPATGADAHLAGLETELRARLGTRVHIKKGRNRGRIVIEYFSDAELSRLVELLRGEESWEG